MKPKKPASSSQQVWKRNYGALERPEVTYYARGLFALQDNIEIDDFYDDDCYDMDDDDDDAEDEEDQEEDEEEEDQQGGAQAKVRQIVASSNT